MAKNPWEVMTVDDYETYKQNKYKAENYGDADNKLNNENNMLRNKYGLTDDSYNYESLKNQSAYGTNPYDYSASNRLKKIKQISNAENPYKNELYSLTENLKNFKYNPESDKDYKAYKDAYSREASASKNKTYSDLTAMTGGRNNSWATAAVSQVGNSYAKQITDMIPELSQRAYDKLLKSYDLKKDQYSSAEQVKQDKIDTELKMYDADVKSADKYRDTNQTQNKDELNQTKTMQDIEKTNKEIEKANQDIEKAKQDIEKGNIELKYLTQNEYIKMILGQLDIEEAKATIALRKAQTAKAYR